KESWALLEDLALYDNESWNDPRDFAKLVKAIVLPQDVPSTSDHRLIELENQVQRLMEAHLGPTQPTQVNKITTSCKICNGPHDTQYCMKNLEQAFVDYTSSRINEVGGKREITVVILVRDRCPRGKVVMSSASSAVTYTSVYTDSEPGRAFWGADDEEISEGGIPRVIVLGYDGLPMQPVAPPSPDYIPGLEDPQTPLVPQAGRMSVSLIYVTESDPGGFSGVRWLDETEDGYPGRRLPFETGDMMEMMMTEIHLGMTLMVKRRMMRTRRKRRRLSSGPDSAHCIRITFRPQAAIILPPEAESLTLPAHSSPPPVPSPLLPSSGCPTQIQTLRIASTQALIDAVTAALPSPPLPPLPPSLYIPPPVDRRDDIPNARPTRGRGIDSGFVSTVDAEERRQGNLESILGSQSLLSSLEHVLHRTCIALLEGMLMDEEEAYASREAWAHAVGLSQEVHYELQTHREQAELLALREQQRRARQPGLDVRVPDHQDASRDADSHI
ncbi:hypothetical protein Tco_1098275, partial [Tanacetum coccineum]